MTSLSLTEKPPFERSRWPLLALQLGLFFSLFGINPTGGIGGEGSVLRQGGWVALALMCLLSASASPEHWARLKHSLRHMRTAIALLVVFWLFALASTMWAEAPLVTFKRAILLGIVLLICTLAAATLHASRTQLADVVITPLVALLVLSVIFSAAFPRIAFTDIGWQGITGQKNSMGQLAAILILALLHGSRATRKAWLWVGVGLAAALAALALSRSSTAMVSLLAAASVVLALRLRGWVRGNPGWAIALYFLFLLMATVVFIAYLGDWLPSLEKARATFFGALGKSENLTGRTKLWDLVMAQHPYRSEIVGGGYGGFWDISHERILYIVSRLGFQPIQAHNGYLDVFNDLGYVGLAILCLVFAYHAYCLATRSKAAADSLHFHFALGTYFFLANFSESTVFRTTQFLNLLFIVSLLLVAAKRRGEHDLRLRPQAVAPAR